MKIAPGETRGTEHPRRPPPSRRAGATLPPPQMAAQAPPAPPQGSASNYPRPAHNGENRKKRAESEPAAWTPPVPPPQNPLFGEPISK
jgi:hypothetical protein